MLSHIVRRVISDMRRFHRTHTLTTNRAFSMSSSGGPIRLDSASDTASKQRHPGVDRSSSPITVPRERSEDMHLSRSYLAILLSLVLLAGLAGCGPASSDNAPNLGPRASVNGPAAAKQNASPSNNSSTQATQAASPDSIASVNGTGSASGMGAVPGGDSSHAVSVVSSEPEHPVEGLVVPELMIQKLNSPNVRVRLRALEAWAQTAPHGAVDPFILAFEDKDERVRALAQQLLEQDWARKTAAEK